MTAVWLVACSGGMSGGGGESSGGDNGAGAGAAPDETGGGDAGQAGDPGGAGGEPGTAGEAGGAGTSGGASPGTGGASAGTGGAQQGTGGASAGTGGVQGTGGASAGTGGAQGAGGGQTQPPPAGKVAVFVAAGNGGRTVTSCDDGRTWIAQEIVADSNDDHHPWTHKGLAYGDGVFLQIAGWGHSPPNLKRSTDGVTWQRLQMPGGFSNTPGGLGFSDGAFVAMESFNSRVSRDGGRTWSNGAGTGHGYHIRGAGGGGRAVGGSGSDRKPAVSWNQGRTFSIVNGCPNMDFGNLGQYGGLAWGADSLVIVSAAGGFCKLREGNVVRTGTVGSNLRGKVVWVGNRFMFPSGTRAFVSPDGETWSQVAFQPGSTNINIVARSTVTGTYVGITQAATGFYRSEDGVRWQQVSGPSGTRLVDLAFGLVDASARCPAAPQ